MSKEVEEAINYFEDREISMKVDVDTDKLLKALGVTEEDSFDKQVYRMETLINKLKEYKHGMTMISEICVDESKYHITSKDAIEEVRKYIVH